MLKLMKYEYRKDLPTYIVLLSALFVAEIYFVLGIATKSKVSIGVSSFLFIFGGVCGVLALMVQGALSYSKEINSKYSYMTFMTPNSTYKIIGAKYISLFIVTALSSVLYVGFVTLDFYLVTREYHDIKAFIRMVEDVADLFGWHTDVYMAVFGALLISVWIGFFGTVSCAYVAITLSSTILANKKGKGVLSVVFFFVITIIINRIASVIPILHLGESFGSQILGNIFVYLFRLVTIGLGYWFVSYMLDKKISL